MVDEAGINAIICLQVSCGYLLASWDLPQLVVPDMWCWYAVRRML